MDLKKQGLTITKAMLGEPDEDDEKMLTQNYQPRLRS